MRGYWHDDRENQPNLIGAVGVALRGYWHGKPAFMFAYAGAVGVALRGSNSQTEFTL